MDWNDRETESSGFGAGVRQVIIVLGVVFAATLAVVVGLQEISVLGKEI